MGHSVYIGRMAESFLINYENGTAELQALDMIPVDFTTKRMFRVRSRDIYSRVADPDPGVLVGSGF